MGTHSRFLFMLGILAVIAVFVLPRPALSDDYKIFFESDRDGEVAIYHLEGDNVVRFTEFGCKHPSVTADGHMLIYTRLVETNWGKYWNAFYYINGEEHKLTTNEIYDELEPVISHDGTFAAYSSLRGTISTYEQQDTQNLEIFTLSFDENDYQYRVTNSPKPDEYPALGNGDEYVYYTGRTGNFSYIFREPGTGGTPERITEDTEGWEEHATVSADGRYMAFASVVETPDDETESDKETDESVTISDSRTIWNHIAAGHDLIVSTLPDGMAYPGMGGGGGATPLPEEDIEMEEDELGEKAEEEDQYSREGNSDIWVLDMETGERTQLTFDEAWDGNPTISADGEVIVFTSDRDGNYEIYRINRDGSGLMRLTNNEATDDFATIS